jgi:hypothetical protein
MSHKYNVGDTVWVAGQSGYITPFQMTITDIHINKEGVYYDGYEMSFKIKEKKLNKSEKLLYLTQADCIDFMNKRTLDDCIAKRDSLLYELEDLNNKIRCYEEMLK